MSLHLIFPAAGSGQRLGSTLPKALVPIGGRSMLARATDAFASLAFEKGVVLAPPGLEREFERVVGRRFQVLAGGATRAESVSIGFSALDARPDDFVAIHDAARPLIGAGEIQSVLDAARRIGAAIAVTSVPDTLKRVQDGLVVGTIERENVVAAATPQVFRADLLRRALLESPPSTDEAAMCERIGIAVAIVPVSRRAFKVTFPEDLELAEALVGRNE